MAELNSSCDGSLSLFELFKILVRRKYFFIIPFLVVLISGSAFVMSRSSVFEYYSYYSIGLVESGVTLESPEEVVLTIVDVDFPELIEGLEKSNGIGSDIELVATMPHNTGLVKLVTVVPDEMEDIVIKIHRSLMDSIHNRQLSLFSRQTSLYRMALDSVNKRLELLPRDGEEYASLLPLLEKKGELELALEQMVPGRKVAIARKGDDPVGIPAVLLIFGVFVFSVFLGLVFAFGAEFSARLSRSLQEENRSV